MTYDGLWKSTCQDKKMGVTVPDPLPPPAPPPTPWGERGPGGIRIHADLAGVENSSAGPYGTLASAGVGRVLDRRPGPSRGIYGTPMAQCARLARHVKRLI